MTQGTLPRSFKAIRVGRPAVDHVDRRPSKINDGVHMLGQNEAYDTRKPQKKFQRNPTCARPNLRWTTTWIAVGSLPRSFKAIQVGRPAVVQVDRRPSKINEAWVNFFSMQNLTCIGWVKMKPRTQGNLPRSFKAIRLARGQIVVGRRRGSPNPPKKFQGDPSQSPGGRPRGSLSIKNQCVVGQLFFYAKSQVHMLGENEAYDTRKPRKKFQCNPTCARTNHQWTMTWIAVGRRPSKINHPWVKFLSMQNLTCICSDKTIPMTQGSLPRSFKAIRVGRPRGSPSIKNQ
ncbi:uncharacterized protein G2W53_026942 [Senna tora]|uniref:Uncharacterized protein n=1 Tax=Senna tora TaxID=362788 RepID=A0A834TFZ1_9FABA|nr:uncharacterized protein G2W53_026942 [Senna tora]